MKKDKVYAAEFFDLFRLQNGVFAAIQNDKPHAGSNAGIVDFGSFTVIFDSFFNVDAARCLRRASAKFTGKEPSFVINSHPHIDHVIGNNVFSRETRVLSTYRIKELIESEGKEFLDSTRKEGLKTIAELEEKIKTENDPAKLRDYENELISTKSLMDPDVVVRPPDVVFKKAMMVSSSGINMHLDVHTEAHSEEDIVAWLPESRVCFMGDLLFSKNHPWIGSGDPDRLILALEEILKRDIEVFVPGHGNLATKEDVLNQILYVRELKELVEKNFDSKERISTADLSPIFKNWRKADFFGRNVDFLRERLKRAKRK